MQNWKFKWLTWQHVACLLVARLSSLPRIDSSRSSLRLASWCMLWLNFDSQQQSSQGKSIIFTHLVTLPEPQSESERERRRERERDSARARPEETKPPWNRQLFVFVATQSEKIKNFKHDFSLRLKLSQGPWSYFKYDFLSPKLRILVGFNLKVSSILILNWVQKHLKLSNFIILDVCISKSYLVKYYWNLRIILFKNISKDFVSNVHK